MNRITEAVMEHGDGKHDSTIDTNIENLIEDHIATDSFTGDGSANRAIPHGLGVIPSMIVLFSATAGLGTHIIIIGVNVVGSHNNFSADFVVTISDTTNFYVGDAAGNVRAGNKNLETYDWVAIG